MPNIYLKVTNKSIPEKRDKGLWENPGPKTLWGPYQDPGPYENPMMN